jgi:hypothetical protein
MMEKERKKWIERKNQERWDWIERQNWIDS